MSCVWAVVVAGGSGRRFGRPKQFSLLAGRPVVERAVAVCRTVAEGVVLVIPPGHVGGTSVAGGPGYGADVVVAGGATRSASVRAGVERVPETATVIVVHDAARPLATPALFRSVVDALGAPGVDGAVCAVPVSDTLKRVNRPLGETDEPVQVLGTVERSTLVSVQTPQAFRAEVLRRAHAGGEDATDDAALVEALGATVRAVPGDARNLKLTAPEDLAIAEGLLGQ